MVRLTKIYTRTGDAGQTGLGDGSRVDKTSPRVEAYGDVDEANSAVGLAAAQLSELCASSAAAKLREWSRIRVALLSIQQDLFDLGADLCAPVTPNEKPGDKLRVTQAHTTRLEKLIDQHNESLDPLESFILPGGSLLASNLHLARAIVRRAERRIAALLGLEPESTNPLTLVYMNRLSDLLFVLARVANKHTGGEGDVLWAPRRQPDEPSADGGGTGVSPV